MIRCQDFFKLGTGHSVKHRCLNALSPFLAPVKAHIVASLRPRSDQPHPPSVPAQTNPNALDPPCHTLHALPHSPPTTSAPHGPPLAEPAVRCSTLRTGSGYPANQNTQHGTTPMWPTARERRGSTGPARSDGQTAREDPLGGGYARWRRSGDKKAFPRKASPPSHLDAPLKVGSRRPVCLPLRLRCPRVSLASHQASLPSSVPDLGSCSRSYLWRSARHVCCYI